MHPSSPQNKKLSFHTSFNKLNFSLNNTDHSSNSSSSAAIDSSSTNPLAKSSLLFCSDDTEDDHFLVRKHLYRCSMNTRRPYGADRLFPKHSPPSPSSNINGIENQTNDSIESDETPIKVDNERRNRLSESDSTSKPENSYSRKNNFEEGSNRRKKDSINDDTDENNPFQNRESASYSSRINFRPSLPPKSPDTHTSITSFIPASSNLESIDTENKNSKIISNDVNNNYEHNKKSISETLNNSETPVDTCFPLQTSQSSVQFVEKFQPKQQSQQTEHQKMDFQNNSRQLLNGQHTIFSVPSPQTTRLQLESIKQRIKSLQSEKETNNNTTKPPQKIKQNIQDKIQEKIQKYRQEQNSKSINSSFDHHNYRSSGQHMQQDINPQKINQQPFNNHSYEPVYQVNSTYLEHQHQHQLVNPPNRVSSVIKKPIYAPPVNKNNQFTKQNNANLIDPYSLNSDTKSDNNHFNNNFQNDNLDKTLVTSSQYDSSDINHNIDGSFFNETDKNENNIEHNNTNSNTNKSDKQPSENDLCILNNKKQNINTEIVLPQRPSSSYISTRNDSKEVTPDKVSINKSDDQESFNEEVMHDNYKNDFESIDSNKKNNEIVSYDNIENKVGHNDNDVPGLNKDNNLIKTDFVDKTIEFDSDNIDEKRDIPNKLANENKERHKKSTITASPCTDVNNQQKQNNYKLPPTPKSKNIDANNNKFNSKINKMSPRKSKKKTTKMEIEDKNTITQRKGDQTEIQKYNQQDQQFDNNKVNWFDDNCLDDTNMRKDENMYLGNKEIEIKLRNDEEIKDEEMDGNNMNSTKQGLADLINKTGDNFNSYDENSKETEEKILSSQNNNNDNDLNDYMNRKTNQKTEDNCEEGMNGELNNFDNPPIQHINETVDKADYDNDLRCNAYGEFVKTPKKQTKSQKVIGGVSKGFGSVYGSTLTGLSSISKSSSEEERQGLSEHQGRASQDRDVFRRTQSMKGTRRVNSGKNPLQQMIEKVRNTAGISPKEQKSLVMMLERRMKNNKEVEERERIKRAWEQEKIIIRNYKMKMAGSNRLSTYSFQNPMLNHNNDERMFLDSSITLDQPEIYCDLDESTTAEQSVLNSTQNLSRSVEKKEHQRKSKSYLALERKKIVEKRLEEKKKRKELEAMLLLEKQQRDQERAEIVKKEKDMIIREKMFRKNEMARQKHEQMKEYNRMKSEGAHEDEQRWRESLETAALKKKELENNKIKDDKESSLVRQRQREHQQQVQQWQQDYLSYKKNQELVAQQTKTKLEEERRNKAAQMREFRQRQQKDNLKQVMEQEKEWKESVLTSISSKESKARKIQRQKEEQALRAKEISEVSRGLRDELRLNQSMNDLHQLNVFIDKHNSINNFNNNDHYNYDSNDKYDFD